MRYRTKLCLVFVTVSFTSAFLGLAISYKDAKKFAIDEFRSKALSIAATTAKLIDGDLLKTIESENSVNYGKLQSQLREAREVNQREDVFVTYIYTLKPVDGNLIMAVSAANLPEETIPVGAIYTSARSALILEHAREVFAPEEFVRDQWGVWLSGYAPIYDSKGQYVATLGIDISAKAIEQELLHLLIIGTYSLGASLALGLIAALMLSKWITRSLSMLTRAVKEIGEGNLDYETKLNTTDEFHDLAEEINKMTKGLKERERLKMSFSRYVSSYVLDKALKSDLPAHLEGERKKITVLFSDIRHFTHFAEKLPPEEVVSILNQYFEKMIEIIFKYNGTLDKFLGDGLMVEFGAPLEDAEQEKHALQAALEMQIEVKKLSEKWESEGKIGLQIGIGIHTGNAVVGNVGSEKRMEYTAIGDTVNVASRLEAATKQLGTPLLISETTYEAIKNLYTFRFVGETSLPGRDETIKTYTI